MVVDVNRPETRDLPLARSSREGKKRCGPGEEEAVCVCTCVQGRKTSLGGLNFYGKLIFIDLDRTTFLFLFFQI